MATVGQGKDHHCSQDPADDDEGTSPATPEPNLVADKPNKGLSKDPCNRSGCPDNTDLVDFKVVFCPEYPAQHHNLDR